MFDRRTPGLFKLEASGDYMVCLASKTYMLKDGAKSKFSCKGVSKRNVCEPEAVYGGVLASRQPYEVRNIGFRARDNTVQTYNQRKTGFSYFYVKREVCANGIDTKPLSLTLSPWPERTCVFVGARSVLSNDYQTPIEYLDTTFFSLHHCYLHEMAVYHECMGKALKILLCPNWFQLHKIQVDIKPTTEWIIHADEFMERMLQLKRNQCSDFDEALRSQPRGHFVYVAGTDRYWTCGVTERIARVVEPTQYPGRNKLGKLLYSMINA